MASELKRCDEPEVDDDMGGFLCGSRLLSLLVLLVVVVVAVLVQLHHSK